MIVGRRNFLVLYFLSCVAFVSTVSAEPYPFDYVVKIVPIFALILFAAQNLTGKTRNLTLAALFFSAGGDVMLSMTFPNQFVFGLASFLIAHIFYVIIFFIHRHSEHLTKKLLFAALVIVYAVVVGGIVMPEQAELQVAVSSYLVIISCMVITAIFAWEKSYIHLFGAISFMISDSIIAWNKFYDPVPFAGIQIMVTYYLAQYLIVTGILGLSQAGASSFSSRGR